jgi:putative phosphoesterase
MRRVGIISDTHGCFDDALRRFLDPVDEIWHAGDFGTIEVADQIAAFKPLIGVRGNIDGGATRLQYPDHQSFSCEGMNVLLKHIVGSPGHYDLPAYALIRSLQPSLLVAGHSHILKVKWDGANNLMFINPGAAGCSGFHRVRTAVRLVIDNGTLSDLEVGEWAR